MTNEISQEKEPIAGWLVLVGIEVWGGALVVPLTLIISIVERLTFRLSYQSFVWFEMSDLFIVSAWSIWVLVLFTRRKKAFINWFIALNCWSIFVQLIDDIFGMMHFNIWENVYALTANILLLLYVLYSKRVRRTFVL